jgi:CheY-like chemotaxis protein
MSVGLERSKGNYALPQRAVRLLIVEDSVEYLHLVREAFLNLKGSHKWELSVAADGEEALSIMLGNGTNTVDFMPDLILLDWNLPKVSGSEVLQQLKAHKELRKIPILVFSSSDAETDIHEAYGYHANGYIKKPMELEALFKIAEAIEIFWVAIAQLTSFKPNRSSRVMRSGIT